MNYLSKNKTLLAFFALVSIALTSCVKSEDQDKGVLDIITEYSLNIPEPSGLTLCTNSDLLYTVSDNSDKIFKITTKGKNLGSFKTGCNDLEGVAYDNTNNNIWIIEEGKRNAVQFDLNGKKLKQISVPVKTIRANKGIEGIAINPVNQHVFVLNEASPGMLVELDANGKLVKSTKLLFAIDYSGVFVNNTGTELWIVSDESAKIYRCNMKGEVLDDYKINVKQAEGIAIDFSKGIVYVVSDYTQKLYLFNLPNN
ncbi:MAG: SdiA-regulated domain-containing protein [Bacteroidales bacterium]|nr:SdiA-regulated domain-containing protein [Bacteroidales bacterium]